MAACSVVGSLLLWPDSIGKNPSENPGKNPGENPGQIYTVDKS